MNRNIRLNPTADLPAGPIVKSYFHYKQVQLATATRASKAGSVLTAADIVGVPKHYVYAYKSEVLRKIFKLHNLKHHFWQRDNPDDEITSRKCPEELFKQMVKDCNGKDFQTGSTL